MIEFGIAAMGPGLPPFGVLSEYAFLDRVDRIRRLQGEFLDLVNKRTEAPHEVIFREAGALALRDYGGEKPGGPVLLIIPAPIKAHYIWDLSPESSVVRQCVRNGVRVFLIEWEMPEGDRAGKGLDDYASRFIMASLDAIAGETGTKRIFLAGHSLGGTFGAIFASLNPGLVKGLILAGSPISFGNNSGDITAFIKTLPRGTSVAPPGKNVPGSFLSLGASLASPVAFIWERWLDWLESFPSPGKRERHLQVARWMRDEMPMDSRLFLEVIDRLYRDNQFMERKLAIGGAPADPRRIISPILCIVDPECRVVPPGSILPIRDSVLGSQVEMVLYKEEPGVALQHVGMLVGENAHHAIWPRVIQWIHAKHHAST